MRVGIYVYVCLWHSMLLWFNVNSYADTSLPITDVEAHTRLYTYLQYFLYHIASLPRILIYRYTQFVYGNGVKHRPHDTFFTSDSIALHYWWLLYTHLHNFLFYIVSFSLIFRISDAAAYVYTRMVIYRYTHFVYGNGIKHERHDTFFTSDSIALNNWWLRFSFRWFSCFF